MRFARIVTLLAVALIAVPVAIVATDTLKVYALP